jgi:hypothetical protein
MGRRFYGGMDEPFLLTCPKSDKAVWQHSRRRLSRASLRATVLKEGKGGPLLYQSSRCSAFAYSAGGIALGTCIFWAQLPS